MALFSELQISMPTVLHLRGDEGRVRPTDGAIMILGRKDEMVKIRGFRVEPAQVAQALSSCTWTDKVVVVASSANPDVEGDSNLCLVAHVVPRDSRATGHTDAFFVS
eukprot:4820419-Amphidinium_carterae.1